MAFNLGEAEGTGASFDNMKDFYEFGLIPEGMRFAMNTETNNPAVNKIKDLIFSGQTGLGPSATLDRDSGSLTLHPVDSKFNAVLSPGLFGSGPSVEVNYDSNRGLAPMVQGSTAEEAISEALMKYELQEKADIINKLNAGNAVELGLQANAFGDGTLLAHVNKEGTAHDWQAPDHGGIRVPGGEVDPHGRRGGITYSDGRAKYTPEQILRKMKDGELGIKSHQGDARFWDQDTGKMLPQYQELVKDLWPGAA